MFNDYWPNRRAYAAAPQNKTTKYEHIIPQLVAIEQNPKIEGLLVILNTVGGDVEAGLAISEMISTLSKPSVSIVLGAAIPSVYRLPCLAPIHL